MKQLNEKLLNATMNRDINKVKELLISGADINAKDSYDQTVLHFAAINGNMDIISLFLQYKIGINIDAVDEYQRSALHLCIERGHLNVASLLMDSGIDIFKKDVWQQTALHIAAKYGHFQIVSMLLDAGLDVDEKDIQGITAEEWAIDGNYHETVEILKQFKQLKLLTEIVKFNDTNFNGNSRARFRNI